MVRPRKYGDTTFIDFYEGEMVMAKGGFLVFLRPVTQTTIPLYSLVPFDELHGSKNSTTPGTFRPFS